MVRIHAGQLSERLKRHSIPDARIAAPFNLCRFVNMHLRFARCASFARFKYSITHSNQHHVPLHPLQL